MRKEIGEESTVGPKQKAGVFGLFGHSMSGKFPFEWTITWNLAEQEEKGMPHQS